ncbi:MAG: hypothetical protein ACM3SQ_12330 [Betaproteobacteria bacterium]
MTAYLVPVGRGRLELYSEAPEDPDSPPESNGWIRRLAWKMRDRWQETVRTARRDDPRGGFARWRAGIICHLAETIAEQRTLWALRDARDATIVYPADVEEIAARTALAAIFDHARRSHRVWLIVDTATFVASGLLMLVPGPNLIAYYFAFRLIGHYLSWRGATQAQDRVRWAAQADARLAELGALAELPRSARATQVEAIARSLQLPRLSAFFDRAAAPAA